MDFQAKLNLPVKQAFTYHYGMQNNKISLTVPIKRKENSFSTLANVDLIIEVNNSTNHEGFSIDTMSIDMQSFSEAIKKLQGRNK